jgi:hypothetical protein
MVTKTKRKVNRTKKAKVGSHGFKVFKNTYVYVAKPTQGGWSRAGKPAPKKECVDALKKHFNTSKSIRKMVKHIKRIKIVYSDSNRFAGTWTNTKKQFQYIDHHSTTPEQAVQVMVHEIDGHAFYHWAEKWRNIEWTTFNELANKMPPVNDYVKTYQKYKVDGRTNTIYENEQHSAVAELVISGESWHKQLINNEDLDKLKSAFNALHY